MLLLKTIIAGKKDKADFFDYFFLVLALIGLFFTSSYNYLLFHSLSELVSIVVAFALFVIAWNSKKYMRNQYLLFVGIAYFFIGFLDLLHTLSYKGMPIFTDYDFYANQLWIGARYLESLSLLWAFSYLYREKPVRPYLLLGAYILLTMLLVFSIFVWKIFPVCFIENQGLTAFKKNSEYIISAILALNIFLLFKNKHRFENVIYQLLLWAMICTIVSELAFTFYISNYGFSNLVGHYFKLFSFILVYEAIIKTALEEPYKIIFHELDETNRQLNDEVITRKRTEIELTKALTEVKTLSGLLPICASCKNIRDDKGYWRQIEVFIRDHSEADFSHGICPDCIQKLYPDLAEDILQKENSVKENASPAVSPSKKYFDRIFEKEWSRCARESKPLSLIIVSFAGITYCDEKQARQVEEILHENLKRPSDNLAGFGDDSFAIILPQTDDRGVRQVAETIMHDYVTFRGQNSGTKISSVNIVISMVTTKPKYEGEPQAILAVAEKNLAVLKGKGIDQLSQTNI